MTRALTHLSCVVVFSGWVCSQPAESPTFEAADIHPSPLARVEYMRGPFIAGARYQVRVATMADLIAAAYGVNSDRVWGGPSWLEWDRFDVIAKVPAGSNNEANNKERLSLMLRALLAERFKLVAHNDSKPMPAFELTAAKHLALKQSGGTGDSGCKFEQPTGPFTPGHPPQWGYTCRNLTMAEFANGMATMDFGPELPVVDKTGLAGKWDFSFKFTFRGIIAAPGETITFFDALEKLGLKLEPGTAPRPVIVVDHVNRVPTPNVPNIAELLPPAPPAEFEVATVKPSDPNSRGRGVRFQPGGRLNVSGLPLSFLVRNAWDVTPDKIIGAPAWMSTDRWDIVAKAPVAEGTPASARVDVDVVWQMVRALLADRFKLAAHFEERPFQAFTLVALKPKLKPADPANRTKFEEVVESGAKDDPRNRNPVLSRLVRCQNMTMAQFAEKLQGIAPGYIHSPVLDATGIQGAFDFVLSFSPAGFAQGRGRGPAAADGSSPGGTAVEAADPSGGITLAEAIEKQLGLKLESQKRPVKVLVIDHIEQKPTEN